MIPDLLNEFQHDCPNVNVSYSFKSKNKTKTLQKQNIYLFCFVVLEPVEKAGALPLNLFVWLVLEILI